MKEGTKERIHMMWVHFYNSLENNVYSDRLVARVTEELKRQVFWGVDITLIIIISLIYAVPHMSDYKVQICEVLCQSYFSVKFLLNIQLLRHGETHL